MGTLGSVYSLVCWMGGSGVGCVGIRGKYGLVGDIGVLRATSLRVNTHSTFLNGSTRGHHFRTLLAFRGVIGLTGRGSMEVLTITNSLFSDGKARERFVRNIFGGVTRDPRVCMIFTTNGRSPLGDRSPFLGGALPGGLCILPTASDIVAFRSLNIGVCNESFRGAHLTNRRQFSLGTSTSFVGVVMRRNSLGSSLNSSCGSVAPGFIGAYNVSCVTLNRMRGGATILALNGARFTCYKYPRNRNFSRLSQGNICLNRVSGRGYSLGFVPVSGHRRVMERVSVAGYSSVSSTILSSLGTGFRGCGSGLCGVRLANDVPPSTILGITRVATHLSRILCFIGVGSGARFTISLRLLSGRPALGNIFIGGVLSLVSGASGGRGIHTTLGMKLHTFCERMGCGRSWVCVCHLLQ